MSELELDALGWSPELASSLEPGLVPGRVVAAHRAAYDVFVGGPAGVVRSRLPGRLAHFDLLDVAVGDWVGLGDGLVRCVLPRRSALVRTAAGLASRPQTLAANVDVVFVVTSLGPDLDLRRLERYLVTVWESGAVPEVVLTKADRFGADEVEAFVAAVEGVAIGVPVWVVSAVTGEGVPELQGRVGYGRTAVLVGSSGVGKSTLVNAWLGREAMETQETRAEDDEGRHTTTHRELLALPGGGVVIDTPGIRELQLWDAGGAGVSSGGASSGGSVGEAFADVEALTAACRFHDCAHGVEPGCAVQEALRDGSLPRERYESWLKLQRELHSTAVRADARLRREEKRKWQQRAKDGRSRTRRH